MYRSYKYLLQPTSKQRDVLTHLLKVQCEVYNAALEERRDAWRMGQHQVTKFGQMRQVKDIRLDRPDVLAYGVVVTRGTLTRLDRAFAAFFRRVRAGQAPGYPRFRSVRRFDTVSWECSSGWAVLPEIGRLRLVGVGCVKVRAHRQLRGTSKALHVKREGRRWFAVVQCEISKPEPRLRTGRQAGFDLGVTKLLASSDGELTINPHIGEATASRLARAQQALALKGRSRTNRRRKAVERVAGVYRKIRNTRRDSLHKLSCQLVNDYDFLAFEKLAISNMTASAKGTLEKPGKNVAQKSGLNRSILDAGWGVLLNMVTYKAEEAGCDLELVNPRNTSITCSVCLLVDKVSRLSQEKFVCSGCGYSAHADVNAARNILRLGLSQHSKSVK